MITHKHTLKTHTGGCYMWDLHQGDLFMISFQSNYNSCKQRFQMTSKNIKISLKICFFFLHFSLSTSRLCSVKGALPHKINLLNWTILITDIINRSMVKKKKVKNWSSSLTILQLYTKNIHVVLHVHCSYHNKKPGVTKMMVPSSQWRTSVCTFWG